MRAPTRCGLASSLLVVVSILAACSEGSPPSRTGAVVAPTSLTAISYSITGRPGGDQLVTLAERAAALSAGSLTLTLGSQPDTARPDTSREAIDAVRSGRVELAVVSARSFDTLGVVTLQAFQAPGVVTSYAMADRVVSDPVVAQMIGGLKPLGLVGLGVTFESIDYPLGWGHPLVDPSSYRGRRIAVRPSSATTALVEALGALPDDRNGGALEEAVAGGEVVGAYESLRHPTSPALGGTITANAPQFLRANVIVANAKVFAGLSPQIRTTLYAAARETQAAAAAGGEAAATLAAAYCASGRGDVALASPAQLAALSAATAPVLATMLGDPTTARALARFRQLKGAPEPEPRACTAARTDGAAAVVVATGDQSELDGIWRLSVEAQALLEGGQTAEDANNNAGTWTFTISRGLFSYTEPGGRICSGTVTLGSGRVGLRGTSIGCDLVWTLAYRRVGTHLTVRPVAGSSGASFDQAFWHNDAVRVGDGP
ncbi:MAG: hypothetical protein ABI890_07185 [Lapillicoccus sp.]